MWSSGEDPSLQKLWHSLQLGLGFDAWPRSIQRPQVQLKKKHTHTHTVTKAKITYTPYLLEILE